jgi:hypothetical protein
MERLRRLGYATAAAVLLMSLAALPGCTTSDASSTAPSDAAPSGERTQRVIDRLQAVEPDLAKYWPGMGGDFPSDNTRVVTLQIGISTDGSLVSLFIVAYAPGTHQLFTGESFGAAGSEYIDIWGAVVDGVTMAQTGATVQSCLAAVDRVGRKTMLAELPMLPPPEFGDFPGDYLLESWPVNGGEPDIPTGAKAVLWNGSAFEALAASDPLRRADPDHVRFVVTPKPSVGSRPAPFPSDSTTTTEAVDLSPVYFVIPVM